MPWRWPRWRCGPESSWSRTCARTARCTRSSGTDRKSDAPNAHAVTPRVLAVADTDSYLKWSAATLRRLPAEWSWTQLVLRNPVQPSAQQMTAAGAGSVQLVDLPELTRRIGQDRPDVVLLAATGPVVETLTALPPFRRRDRPLLVTGLPDGGGPIGADGLPERLP